MGSFCPKNWFELSQIYNFSKQANYKLLILQIQAAGKMLIWGSFLMKMGSFCTKNWFKRFERYGSNCHELVQTG